MTDLVEINISELEGEALDWAAATVCGHPVIMVQGRPAIPWGNAITGCNPAGVSFWRPSSDWSQGGPLIEKHWMKMQRHLCWWLGRDWANTLRGDHLLWLMRAVVAANSERPKVSVPRCIVEGE